MALAGDQKPFSVLCELVSPDVSAAVYKCIL